MLSICKLMSVSYWWTQSAVKGQAVEVHSMKCLNVDMSIWGMLFQEKQHKLMSIHLPPAIAFSKKYN